MKKNILIFVLAVLINIALCLAQTTTTTLAGTHCDNQEVYTLAECNYATIQGASYCEVSCEYNLWYSSIDDYHCKWEVDSEAPQGGWCIRDTRCNVDARCGDPDFPPPEISLTTTSTDIIPEFGNIPSLFIVAIVIVAVSIAIIIIKKNK